MPVSLLTINRKRFASKMILNKILKRMTRADRVVASRISARHNRSAVTNSSLACDACKIMTK